VSRNFPPDLVESTLADVCSLVTDGTHDTPKRVSVGYPLIKAKEIANGRIEFEDCDQISEADHLRVIARSKPERGDTLFTHIGASLGAAAFVGTPQPFSIKNIALFKPDPSRIDGRYLFYLVISPDFQELAKSARTGSAQPFLSLGHLRGHRIRYHRDIGVQRHIGAMLSAYDDLIDNNARRIAILEEMARRIFDEWFVHFRAPGCEGLPMVDSAIGPAPQGWEVKALRELADVNPEQISPRSAPAAISYIDIASVSPGSIDAISEMPFIEAPNRARRIVRHGDVIWSCVRPNRRSFALVLHPSADTVASTGFAVLRSKHVPWPYLYMIATTQAFTDYLTNHATGSAYPAVKAEDFEKAELLVPPKQLLARYSQATEPMLSLTHALRRQNVNLRAQRDLLLPKLISGEIEISAASASLKEAAE
jgi:type I restriction enzyme S subunit